MADDEPIVWIVASTGMTEAAPEVPSEPRQPKASAPLPAYSGDGARCSKCGMTGMAEPGVATGYVRTPDLEKMEAQRANQAHPWAAMFGHPSMSGQQIQLPPWMEGLAAEQELLARVCQRCGFVWAEACLDDPNGVLDRL